MEVRGKGGEQGRCPSARAYPSLQGSQLPLPSKEAEALIGHCLLLAKCPHLAHGFCYRFGPALACAEDLPGLGAACPGRQGPTEIPPETQERRQADTEVAKPARRGAPWPRQFERDLRSA